MNTINIITQHGGEGDRLVWRNRLPIRVTVFFVTLLLTSELVCIFLHYVVSDWILPEKPDVVMWHLFFIVLTMPIYILLYLLCVNAIGIRGEIQRNSRLLTVAMGFGTMKQMPRTEVDMVELVAASPLRFVWHVILHRRDNKRPVLLATFHVIPRFERHERSLAADYFVTTVGEWLDCPVKRD